MCDEAATLLIEREKEALREEIDRLRERVEEFVGESNGQELQGRRPQRQR